MNVHRHSGASIVDIALKRSLQVVIMEAHDDGREIAPAMLDRLRRANTDGGVGLAGMRERVNDLNGLWISSRIHVVPPYASVCRWPEPSSQCRQKRQVETGVQHNNEEVPLCLQLRDKPGVHILLLFADGANCRYQFLRGIRFDHIAAAAAPEGLPDCLEAVVLAQKEDFSAWGSFLYAPGRLESVHSGHRNIQDHNVGLQLTCLCDSLVSIRHVTDHVKIGLSTEESADLGPYDRTIVNNENTKRPHQDAPRKPPYCTGIRRHVDIPGIRTRSRSVSAAPR